MSHLDDVNHTYFQHLRRAWKIAFILFIHGLFPEIWKTKASDELCQKNKYNSSRAHLLKAMYGIEEK
jgi:hypothetical protein